MHRQRLVSGGALLIAALALTASQASAAVVHRYNFNGNVNDSVGTANGTLIDAGVLPSATFTAGQLDLTGNVGNSSENIVEDAYVNLPNDIISAAATTNGALTLEVWATVSTNRTWQRLVDFGTSNGGEDVSNGAGTTNYLYISPNHGRFADGIATEVHQQDTAFEVGIPGAPATNRQYHIVGTYDHNDTAGGANPNGTTRLYVDGTLIGSVQLAPNVDLRTFINNNNWIARSQWGDPVFDGLINEFRIHNTAVTQAQVTQGAAFGPDVLNPNGLVSLEVNKSTGAITLKNTATAPLAIDQYNITSAGGALSLANWNSLDDQNYDAIDGTDVGTVPGDSPGEGWDQAGGSSVNQLVEQFLGSGGSSIAAGESISLGNAFNTSIFGPGVDGDLQFSFAVNSGALIASTVTYVGGGGQPGDFDVDGDVDGNDFLVWQRGLGTTHSAATLATWKANFGAPAVAAAGAVPEPSSIALMLAAGLLLAARRSQA